MQSMFGELLVWHYIGIIAHDIGVYSTIQERIGYFFGMPNLPNLSWCIPRDPPKFASERSLCSDWITPEPTQSTDPASTKTPNPNAMNPDASARMSFFGHFSWFFLLPTFLQADTEAKEGSNKESSPINRGIFEHPFQFGGRVAATYPEAL